MQNLSNDKENDKLHSIGSGGGAPLNKENENRDMSLFGKIGKANNTVSVIAGVAAIIGSIYILYVWAEGVISSVVSQRLDPYQSIIISLSLNQNEDYDRALDMLYPTLRKYKNNPIDEKIVSPFVDAYLAALANCDEPIEYTNHYVRLKEVMKEDIPEHPWRDYQQAWYFFRIGRVKESREFIDHALRDQRSDELPALSADLYFLSAMTYVAEGNISQATDLVRLAEIRDYKYSGEKMANERYYYLHDRRFSGLPKYYKSYEKNMIDFIDRVGGRNEK